MGETVAVYENNTPAFYNIFAGDEIIGQFDGQDRRYHVKDHLGSIRMTINDSQGIDGYQDYYPFGKVMPGRSFTSGNLYDNYKFTGHERDDEFDLTLDYMQARMYDPEIGRFLSVDPLASEFPSWSPYNYALNNPLIFFDPDGKAAVNSNCCYGLRGSSFERYVGSFFVDASNKTANTIKNATSEAYSFASTVSSELMSSQMIGDGLRTTAIGFASNNRSIQALGIQTTMDGVADVSGRIETLSAIGTLNPATSPVVTPLFGVSTAISTASDVGATSIEFGRWLEGSSTGTELTNRAFWTTINTSIPGRVSSYFQGREDAAKGMSGSILRQTQEFLEEL